MKRSVIRIGLSAIYAAAGTLHLVLPAPFVSIVPPWVPEPRLIVAATGVAELAGAACLAQTISPTLRKAAGWGLAAYALCVWPANFQHMLIDMRSPDQGLRLAYHIPRLLLQPVLIWLPLWAAGITFRKR
jgi:Predicted membrane protein